MMDVACQKGPEVWVRVVKGVMMRIMYSIERFNGIF